MDPQAKYNLTRVINACGKMTALSGARVLPSVVDAAAAMREFFVLDELQAAAGR
jgi:seryl-tRNA(Sec) selenium transferase